MELSIWQEFNDQDFIVLGISNQSIPEITQFIEDQGITFPVLHDDANVYHDYNLPGGQSPYPRDFIVDQLGILQYANVEYDPGSMMLVIESLLYTEPAQRTVLAELFGATWCYSCSLASEAIDSLVQEFGPDSLVVLEYHWADEYTVPEGEDRARWYVPGPFNIPNMWFDGIINVVGANSGTYDTYRNHILTRSGEPSPLEISLEVRPDQARAGIKVVQALTEPALKTYMVLFENDVDGYDYVVRDILPTEALSAASIGDSIEVVRSFSLDIAWQAENMNVAVFVQSDSSKLVLQSAQKPLAPYLFVRGDANGDEILNVGDVVYLVSYLYKGGPAPDPLGSGDANCDDIINVGDVVYLVTYLYKRGPAPGC